MCPWPLHHSGRYDVSPDQYCRHLSECPVVTAERAKQEGSACGLRGRGGRRSATNSGTLSNRGSCSRSRAAACLPPESKTDHQPIQPDLCQERGSRRRTFFPFVRYERAYARPNIAFRLRPSWSVSASSRTALIFCQERKTVSTVKPR